MTEPNLSLRQAQAAVEQKTAPRVTLQGLKAKIKEARYFLDGTLTICVLEMANGFKQIGKAAPADERNFDVEVGKRYAYEDAFRGLWALEGYLLCSILRGEVQLPELVLTDEVVGNGGTVYIKGNWRLEAGRLVAEMPNGTIYSINADDLREALS